MGQLAVREGNYKYYRDRDGQESLFDLGSDIHEDTDLKQRFPEIFDRLKARAYAEHRDYEPTPIPGGPLRKAPQGVI